MRQALIPPELAEAARVSGFSPAIRAGDMLYLTGATGGDPATGEMPADAATQARNALTKVINILHHAGADAAAVVEMTSYHVDIRTHFPAIEAVLREVFTAPLPAWTAVGVAELRRPGALIEFRITAHCLQDPDGSA
ncbi:MAG: Rid family hydrolase [Pseudomonadota bacterium]